MKFAAFALSAVIAAAAASAAHAAGSESTSSSTPTCKKGEVYSSSKKKCVKQTSEVVPDRSLKAQGWALARAGQYDAAIQLFRLVADSSDPEALNGLGYSHRKLGLVEQGIAFYKKALDVNPDYVLAREYLGEGYVKMGRIDLAREQLAEIGSRCGTACEEYLLLAQAIDTGKPIY
ncbi:MAG: tetratricopeptide repeat protein [Anderseniella sp.]|jgi:tetratricopeptide (TPR) repeat protein|nr:tetratricopeptide repeat protein [Anderseniella sp.]